MKQACHRTAGRLYNKYGIMWNPKNPDHRIEDFMFYDHEREDDTDITTLQPMGGKNLEEEVVTMLTNPSKNYHSIHKSTLQKWIDTSIQMENRCWLNDMESGEHLQRLRQDEWPHALEHPLLFETAIMHPLSPPLSSRKKKLSLPGSLALRLGDAESRDMLDQVKLELLHCMDEDGASSSSSSWEVDSISPDLLRLNDRGFKLRLLHANQAIVARLSVESTTPVYNKQLGVDMEPIIPYIEIFHKVTMVPLCHMLWSNIRQTMPELEAELHFDYEQDMKNVQLALENIAHWSRVVPHFYGGNSEIFMQKVYALQVWIGPEKLYIRRQLLPNPILPAFPKLGVGYSVDISNRVPTSLQCKTLGSLVHLVHHTKQKVMQALYEALDTGSHHMDDDDDVYLISEQSSWPHIMFEHNENKKEEELQYHFEFSPCAYKTLDYGSSFEMDKHIKTNYVLNIRGFRRKNHKRMLFWEVYFDPMQQSKNAPLACAHILLQSMKEK